MVVAGATVLLFVLPAEFDIDPTGFGKLTGLTKIADPGMSPEQKRGALLAILLFGEPVTLQLLAAAVLMGVGLYLHLAERHDHEHAHDPMAHSHAHVHDEHHQHAHGPDDPEGEPHVHHHVHARLIHAHPHYPDLHHRHGHA